MPLPQTPLPKAPQPTKIFFDPYNSSSTGHQRAENRLSGSTSWRDSRTYKLAHQLSDTSGRGGDQHLSDLVGAGSEDFGKDGRKENGDWEVGAPGLREKGWRDIRDLMAGPSKRKIGALNDASEPKAENNAGEPTSIKRCKSDPSPGEVPEVMEAVDQSQSDNDALPFSSAQPPRKTSQPSQERVHSKDSDNAMSATKRNEESRTTQRSPGTIRRPQIFRGLTIYLNGTTAPLVSDHKLKQLFAQHGGNAAIALGRRTVTHVIIGESCGGGLASTKFQKEIKTVGGKGIMFVTPQWVLDSVERGIRQQEARYAPKNVMGRIGGSRQPSVLGRFTKSDVR
jgi:hypothetical protein